MKRCFSTLLCIPSLLGLIAGAQTPTTEAPVTVTVAGGPAGASAATAQANTAFNTVPFSTYFGAPIDPSFTNLQGQVTADLNGDGAPDLLLYGNIESGSSPSAIRVQSFISNGKGGFTAQTPQLLTLAAAFGGKLAVIDVDDNGKLDLLIGTALAYGNGDGTFAQPVTPSFLATQFDETYAADVTGDGKLDIIAVNTIPSAILGQSASVPLVVTVLANQGSGTFKPLGTVTLGTGYYSEGVTLASLSFVDLNNDGKPDMVAQMYFIGAGNAEAPATVSAALNNGEGTFAAAVPVLYTAQQNGGSIELLSVQAADFNRDNKVDLALIYPPPLQTSLTYASQILFLPGNGDGTFGPETDSTVSTTVLAGATSAQPPAGDAVVTDANLDGAPDLVFGSGAVAVGDGKGNFAMGTPLVEVAIPALPAAIGYVNSALLGPIPSAAGTYPDLVFTSVGSGTAPFPLVAVSTATAFNVQSGSGSPSITVTSGQSASVALSVTGVANYAGSVTLTCAGLPANASCSFNPATLSLAGGKPQSSTLTVSTAGGSPAAMINPFLGSSLTRLSCGLAGGLLLLWPKRRRPPLATMMIAIALVAFSQLLSGCGGNSQPATSRSTNTLSGTYSFDLIATAGKTQTTTKFTLVVQ